MDWLIPSITATLVGTALLAFVYLYLFVHDRRKYLLVWSVSWSVYFLRYTFMLFIAAGNESIVLPIANQAASLLSGVFLLRGTYLFIGKRFPRLWIYGAVAGFSWIIVSNLLRFSFTLATAPTFVFLALVCVWTGVEYIRSDITGACAKHITGWTFIIWGLHKADYPFLRPVAWFAPAGYLMGAAFEFAVALGMLLVYFHKIRAELKQEQRLLQKAQEIGSVGTWALDIRNNELLWTEETYRIFGIPAGTKLTYETFLSRIHPEDREYVDQAWKESLKRKPYDIEHRIVVDGEVKWVQEKAELELFRRDPHRFDLLVTDMTMPRMNGDVLAAEIRSIRANIPVILCTGYSSQVSEQRAVGIGIREFVSKPFTRNEMASAIRRALDN